jgi:hypothetical protein
MTRIISLALACSLLLLTGLPAFARDDKPVKKEAREDARFSACKADMEKYCKDVKPGDGRIMVCMQSNADRLSPECATVMKEKAQHEKAMREKKMGDKKVGAEKR